MNNIKLEIISFLLCFTVYPSSVESHIENSLREYMFINYSSSIRPVNNQETTVNVTFNMKLMQILSVDERHQKITTQAYFAIRWRNELLKWEPKDWGNINYLAVSPGIVWIPDVILKNNANGNAVTVQNRTDKVWISYTGKHSWYPNVMLISSFKADVADFPFDKQKFIFHFGSWSLGEDKLRISKDDKPMIAKYFVNSTEWELLKMSKEIVKSTYDTDVYSEIEFVYIFSRKPSYCVMTVILPCVMLMSIALFSYILPAHNRERIGVLTTLLLAFTVFLVEINISLPRTSDSIPIMKVFYIVTITECILCFLSTCLVIRLLDNKDNKRLPFCIPILLKNYIFRIKEKQLGPSAWNGNYSKIGKIDARKVTSREKATEMPEANSVNVADSVNINAKEQSIKTNDVRENYGNEKDDNEITWEIFAEYLDKVCLYCFSFLFLITSFGILFPAYYRKYH